MKRKMTYKGNVQITLSSEQIEVLTNFLDCLTQEVIDRFTTQSDVINDIADFLTQNETYTK